MNLKWDYQLTGDQLPNPVLYHEENIGGITFEFDEAELLKVLTAKNHQLKTWGKGASTKDPHWIGVKKATPLHTDPHYPRYTHHLIVHVDPFGLRGIDKESLVLQNNQYVVIDTHSPHQLHSLMRGATYYLAVSIDSWEVLPKGDVLPLLVAYANSQPIAENTERIRI